MKTFYRMKLIPTESGLTIWTDEYYSVHETPCYHFCIAEWLRASYEIANHDYKSLKKRGVKLKKIAKLGSRFAFETKEQAFNNLIYLKGRQLMHMKRDMEFLKTFLEFNDTKGFNDLEEKYGSLVVPGTKPLVLNHFNFD